MAYGRVVANVVEFLRAGVPSGVPSTGYVSLLALLPRRVSDEEIATLAEHFAGTPSAVTATDIGVALTRMLGALPSDRDVQRVASRLVTDGTAVTITDP
jgi:Protein of unknown function (DUF3349)